MLKVAKFGGSSVANAAQFRKVRQIVEADPDRKFVITSACGKESSEDHKITDLLYLCEAHVRYGVSYEPIFEKIEEKYRSIQRELGLRIDLDEEFRKIRSCMKKGMSRDYLVSRGEYLTAKCLAEYLDFDFVDASGLIAFHYDSTVDLPKTAGLLREHCRGKGIVIPGFYGFMPNGAIRVMRRGGSDITGAVIANVLDADIYENWTDVSGFHVADPKIVEDPYQIPRINYSELREMSYMGARVLQDEAIYPVKQKDIPVNIRNTNDPENPGTLIMRSCEEEDRLDPPHMITGITGKKNFTIITLSKLHSSSEVGFLRRLLSVFEAYRIPVENIPMTIDTFSVIVDSDIISEHLFEISAQLQDELTPDDIRIEDHVALIAIVGRAMTKRPGMSAKLLSVFEKNDINIKTLSQSTAELSLLVGISDEDFDRSIRCLYAKFIREEQKVLQAGNAEAHPFDTIPSA